jgi:hypothetical protein
MPGRRRDGARIGFPFPNSEISCFPSDLVIFWDDDNLLRISSLKGQRPSTVLRLRAVSVPPTATERRRTWAMAAAAPAKRPREVEWRPDIQFPENGSLEEEALRAKMKRTSLLYIELQAQVRFALMQRRKRDAEEMRLSGEIAKRNPLQMPCDAPAHTQVECSSGARVQQCQAQEVAASSSDAEQTLEIALKAKPRVEAARDMPHPLTQAILDEAFTQLDHGTQASIKNCLKCWRENKLDSSDVLETVKSFSGSCAALKQVFVMDEGEGEVASTEEMRELARQAMAL